MSVYSFVYTAIILITDYQDYVRNITSVSRISEKRVSSEIKRHITKNYALSDNIHVYVKKIPIPAVSFEHTNTYKVIYVRYSRRTRPLHVPSSVRKARYQL